MKSAIRTSKQPIIQAFLLAPPNILDRNFDVVAPDKVWTTDITYVWTLEGWLYVAIVPDLFSRQIVGWAIDDHMQTSLCIRALQMAFWRRKPERGLLHHSDQGANMPVMITVNTWLSWEWSKA